MNAQIYFHDLNKRVAAIGSDTFKGDERLTQEAKEIINNYQSISGTLDVFIVFAAFNYLNAKAKHDKDYSFKGKIESVVNFTLQKTDKIGFFFERNSKSTVFYVDFYGFVFSFHAVSFSKYLADKLSKAKKISFDGVRKQPAASYILEDALRMKGNQTDSTNVRPVKVAASSSTYIPHNNGSSNISFSYREVKISEINNKFHVSKLCTTKETATNICVVISNCYFLKDLIVNGNLSNVLKTSSLRLLVTQIDSIVEAIELEVGAKFLRTIRNSPKHDLKLDSSCLKEFKKRIKLSDSTTRTTYDNLHKSRNNIHLCKYQPIIYQNTEFDENKVETYFEFTMQYIQFIYNTFKF